MEFDEVVIFPDSLSTSVSPTFFHNSVVIFGSFLILFILIVLLWLSLLSKSYLVVDPNRIFKNLPSNVKPAIAQRRDNNGTPGESNDEDGRVFFSGNGEGIDNKIECNEQSTSRWVTGSCKCYPPFFGRRCELESHGPEYYAVGNYSFENPSHTKDDGWIPVNRKSFLFSGIDPNQQVTCENLCADDDTCLGFHYINEEINLSVESTIPTGYCKLIREPLDGNKIMRYDPYGTNDTYLVKTERPMFKNRVFLTEEKNPNRLRFWLDAGIENDGKKIQILNHGTVYRLNWTPKGVINDSNFSIVVSNIFFTSKKGIEMSKMSKIPEGWYVSKPGDTFNPPYKIVAAKKNFWIMAINTEKPTIKKNQSNKISFKKTVPIKTVPIKIAEETDRTPTDPYSNYNSFKAEISIDCKTPTDNSFGGINSEWD
jgi:hypothetical protein